MIMRTTSRLAPLSLSLACGRVLSGCTHLGPKTVAVDRFDYGTAIVESWKQQTLLNLVKLRHRDLPVLVDVVFIVSGYSRKCSALDVFSWNFCGTKTAFMAWSSSTPSMPWDSKNSVLLLALSLAVTLCRTTHGFGAARMLGRRDYAEPSSSASTPSALFRLLLQLAEALGFGKRGPGSSADTAIGRR
jgi:hypothetical protein